MSKLTLVKASNGYIILDEESGKALIAKDFIDLIAKLVDICEEPFEVHRNPKK